MSVLNRYLPSGGFLYVWAASVVSLLGIAGALQGTNATGELRRGLEALDVPAGWVLAAAAWNGSHRDLVGTLGLALVVIGLAGCAGATGRESNAGPTFALGVGLVLEARYLSLWVLALCVVVRLVVEWLRVDRWRRADATADTGLAVVLGVIAAPLYAVSWLVGTPGGRRPHSVRVVSLPAGPVEVSVRDRKTENASVTARW